MEAQERQKRIAQSPGGLDPYEVLDSLPQAMREAFEARDMAKLQEVLRTMDLKDAQHHMKRCVDSGLWVPGGANAGDADASGAPEDDEGNEGDAPTDEAAAAASAATAPSNSA